MYSQIDRYLKNMQDESPNCGGTYHFTKINLPAGKNLYHSLQNYLLTIEAYQNPIVEVQKKKIVVENRLIDNLRLTKVFDYRQLIEDKLKYWREHRTSVDCRKELSDQYYQKEKMFKESILTFINNQSELDIYLLEGVDTSFANEIGGDMVGDDILFKTNIGIYVLHFGWSS